MSAGWNFSPRNLIEFLALVYEGRLIREERA
jgi:hypothetical protein